MKKTISGRIVTHEKDFIGKITFDETTGLIDLAEECSDNGDIVYPIDECIIFPGFGDIHVHAREDASGKHTYKEDFISAGNAALNGGSVHIADMPNNPIPPIDDESYNKKEILSKKCPVHVTLYAGIGPGTLPLSRKVPYKVFMGPSIGELFFKDNIELENTIKNYRGQNVSFHCEDPIILEKSGKEEFHEDRRPVEAEITATEFALYLIEKYSLKGKLCHYSSGRGLDKIIEAKRNGIPVTCEVTPTHLFFDRTMLNDSNRKWFQMNPPLRMPEDRMRLIEAVKDGHIDYLATDHAPHSVEEKLKGISGISQLDTYSLFVTHLLVNESVSPIRIATICSKNPGDFINPFLTVDFGKGFGYIEKGYSASFTILNLNKEAKFSKENIKSKSGWSPFENHIFPGSIENVYFKGKSMKI